MKLLKYVENSKKNGMEICSNTNKILDSLCRNIELITGKGCSFDILFDGSVVIVCDEFCSRELFKNVFDAIEYLLDVTKSLY